MSSSIDVMTIYYDSLADGDLETVTDCFDIPSKLISLYGVVDMSNREDILRTYTDLIESWEGQGISKRIGYDKDTFEISRIQENIDMVKTKLTNHDLNGNFLQKWDCTYVLRNESNRWLISLATTNNQSSKTMRNY